jgi:hypothetical protein
MRIAGSHLEALAGTYAYERGGVFRLHELAFSRLILRTTNKKNLPQQKEFSSGRDRGLD